MGFLTLHNETRGTQIAAHIVVADTSLRRMSGLLGKRHLTSEEGLWIRPCSGVHTIGMSFPIDVIGLDQARQVVKLWENLRPFRLTSLSWKVRSVIELRAGTIGENGIQLGDTLSLTRFELQGSVCA